MNLNINKSLQNLERIERNLSLQNNNLKLNKNKKVIPKLLSNKLQRNFYKVKAKIKIGLK